MKCAPNNDDFYAVETPREAVYSSAFLSQVYNREHCPVWVATKTTHSCIRLNQ